MNILLNIDFLHEFLVFEKETLETTNLIDNEAKGKIQKMIGELETAPVLKKTMDFTFGMRNMLMVIVIDSIITLSGCLIAAVLFISSLAVIIIASLGTLCFILSFVRIFMLMRNSDKQVPEIVDNFIEISVKNNAELEKIRLKSKIRYEFVEYYGEEKGKVNHVRKGSANYKHIIWIEIYSLEENYIPPNP